MKFGLLGEMYVEDDDGNAVPVSAPKVRALLAALLLPPRRVAPVDTLVDVIWDGRPPANVQASLHNQVMRLRRTLGDRDTRIRTRASGYLLDVDDDEVDVQLFKNLCERGSRAYRAGEWSRAVTTLDTALGLWRGRPLSDVPAPALVDREVPALEESRVQALECRIAAEHRLGHYSATIAELQAITSAHPLRERFWAQLMLAYYRSGRRADALATYRRTRQILADELGVEPAAELRALQHDMLTADVAPYPSPDGERIEVSRVVVTTLPTPPEPFVGRAEELSLLEKLGSGTIVIITGTAGVGKTALALHWARRVADRFPDGQLYVDLRGYAANSPLRTIDALGILLTALGVPGARIPIDADRAAAVYRAEITGRRMLLVLDNAASAADVRALLPGDPHCQVITTSRDSLTGLIAVEGARRVDLNLFSPEESRKLIGDLLGAERLAGDPEAVDRLARACAHLPLALRIAAANLLDQPDRGLGAHAAAMVDGDRLSMLEVDGDRSTAVRAALDPSYARLDPESQRLFRALALVPGADITPGAAAALVATVPGEAARMLDELARAHLVRKAPGDRYAAHDLLRCYAADRLAFDEPEPAQREATERLLDWYLRSTDAAGRRLYPGMPRAQKAGEDTEPDDYFVTGDDAARWLNAERFNLLAAIRYAAGEGMLVAARLAATLRGHLWHTGTTIELLDAARAGLDVAVHHGDTPAQVALRLGLGMAHYRVGDLPAAAVHYAGAAQAAHRMGWAHGRAAALGNLGLVHRDLGDFGLSARHHWASLELDRSAGNVAGTAISLGNLGELYHQWGQLDRAVELHGDAVALLEPLDTPTEHALALGCLGAAEGDLGRFDAAERHVTEALALCRRTQSRTVESIVLRFTADLLHARGLAEPAADAAASARTLAHTLGDRQTEAAALHRLGVIRLDQHRSAEAIMLLQRALTLARACQAWYVEVQALVGLGTARLAADGPTVAGLLAARAARLAEDADFRLLRARVADLCEAVSRTANGNLAASR